MKEFIINAKEFAIALLKDDTLNPADVQDEGVTCFYTFVGSRKDYYYIINEENHSLGGSMGDVLIMCLLTGQSAKFLFSYEKGFEMKLSVYRSNDTDTINDTRIILG